MLYTIFLLGSEQLGAVSLSDGKVKYVDVVVYVASKLNTSFLYLCSTAECYVGLFSSDCTEMYWTSQDLWNKRLKKA